jgi:CBS domain containing-hemolysin-like protein
VLVVAEFLPKILFRINPNGILSFFAVPTLAFYYLLYPLTLVYSGIAYLIIRVFFGMKMDQQQYQISTVDFDDYITSLAPSKEADEDFQQEIQLFQNAMEFRSVKLRECMGPRNEIEAVKLSDNLNALKDRFEETKHSKLIVYSDNIDNIVGYIHLNDVVEAIAHGKTVTAADLVRSIAFFPETYTADRLLKHFIQKHQGVAVVVDEFGGTAGIVTMEDVIEEIVGEINDEFDNVKQEEHYTKIDEDTYLFKAQTSIVDFCKVFNVSENYFEPMQGEADTLAGLVLEIEGRIPEVGFSFNIEKFHFEITEADTRKIIQIKVKVL